MTEKNRVVVESGRKKVFASAVDWPGWSRSGKTEDAALDALTGYVDRYQNVVTIAGESGVAEVAASFDVIERLEGSGATDFGVPDKVAECDRDAMTAEECERQIQILRACWRYFDDTSSRVSEELQKGPRGGGRNRSAIVEHVYGADRGYARRIGVKTPTDADFSPESLKSHRDAVCDAILRISESGQAATSWPLRYFIRRAAWHLLDHAWEMEDKDLTGKG